MFRLFTCQIHHINYLFVNFIYMCYIYIYIIIAILVLVVGE